MFVKLLFMININLASPLLVHFSVVPKRSFMDPGGPQLAFWERLYFRLDMYENISGELLAYSYIVMDDNSDS